MNIEDGWNSAQWDYPKLRDAPIIMMRDGWVMPVVGTWGSVDPASNIIGLFWKKTGIYREREAGLPSKVDHCGNYASLSNSLRWPIV